MPTQNLAEILRLSPHDKTTQDLFETAFNKAVAGVVNAWLIDIDAALTHMCVDIKKLGERVDELDRKISGINRPLD